MLNSEELSSWYKRTGLSLQARSLIDHVRSSPPARHVRAGRSNVCGRYPSRKMGVTIQFESHRVELAGIYEMEHDADVLEYYDQPPPLKLNYESARGRLMGVFHTPDFFIIRTAAAGWEEWKSEEDLLWLTEHNRNRYSLDENGHWCCPPGEAQASVLGLYYRVRSSREIDWIYQRNVQFMEDYLRAGSLTVDHGVQKAVLAAIATDPQITLSGLFEATEGAVSRDEIYHLIAAGTIQIDLASAPLIEPDLVYVHPQEGRRMSDSKVRPSVVSPRNDGTTESSQDHQNQEFQTGPDQMAEANRRLQLIQAYQAGEALGENVSGRTIREWIRRYRLEEAASGNGYLGLLPRLHQSGNRNRKLPHRTQALMTQFIENDYETLKQKPKIHVYGALLRACEIHGTPAPSYKTFCKEVNRRPQFEQTYKRRGRRAAYPFEASWLGLEITTPRHGERPFQTCHVDHTELDVELLCSATGRNLGRPWFTLLTDAYSRRLLAVLLSFDPPSYRSCMMILRECVRRYGRLPQLLVVDGGKEFESVYFESLLARYECTKKTRPPAKARFGSVCERLFGTTNTQFVYCLSGNTQISKEVRVVTASVDPKNHAVWTLGRLYDRLCQWAYEIYDTTLHPALGQSPRDCFADGVARAGHRNHRTIPYDNEFRMMTLPTTVKGTALISSGKGVKINHLYYWSSVFRDPAVEQTRVPVRYDPFDAGGAYAFVGSRWVSCCSEHYAVFRGRSEREMMLAAAELRKRSRKHSANLQVTARRLADFISSVEAEESLLLQRLRDTESRQVRSIVNGHKGDERSTSPNEGASQPPASEQNAIHVPTPSEAVALPEPELLEEY